MTKPTKEELARIRFERWASVGTRPIIYPLDRLAGGEYVSIYTEMVWRAYRDGCMKVTDRVTGE